MCDKKNVIKYEYNFTSSILFKSLFYDINVVFGGKNAQDKGLIK